MKLKISALLLLFLFIFAGCGKITDSDNSDGINETEGMQSQTTAENGKAAESNNESNKQETISDNADDVIAPSDNGCLYGENTGTDKTYTGLEPLPLSTFPDAVFENTKNLSNELREHSYGVAKDGEPHQISVSNQKFFYENGYKAVALDAKARGKILYLTFDCGYENGYTEKILDVLRDKDVKAAFFCTLPEMKENPDIIARMITEGHIVGNHSVTHPNFAELTREEMYEEVKGFDDYLREHFGFSAPYFRYPQGKYSENSLDMLNSMGYKCIFWSLAYADWDLDDQKGAQYATETVVSRLHPGAVILLHSVSPDNASALSDIIDKAREQGYEFRSLNEIDI